MAWSSPSHCAFKTDPTAFLFTLTNPANMPLKLKIEAGQEGNAVEHHSGYGPRFGNGADLYVSDESNKNMNSFVYSLSYDAPNGRMGEAGGRFIHGGANFNFQTEEVEVFQVI